MHDKDNRAEDNIQRVSKKADVDNNSDEEISISAALKVDVEPVLYDSTTNKVGREEVPNKEPDKEKAEENSKKDNKDPERVVKWFAARPPKSEKDEELTLKRLTVGKVQYVFLLAWFTIAFFAGRAFRLYYFPHELAFSDARITAITLAVACILFCFFSLLAAKSHAKQFDANITNIFEYMLRQDKPFFSYRKRGSPEHDSEGSHKLHKVTDAQEEDKLDSYSNDDTVIKITKDYKANPLKSSHEKYLAERMKTEHISNIEEVYIGNQTTDRNNPVFLKKNNKIREMLISDRSQLIAFCAMHVFAMLAGSLLGYGAL